MARDERYRRLINTREWRAHRNVALASHPLCEDCEKRGMLTPATEVHHIVPVESARTEGEMRELAYSRGNLACLCHACHTDRHRALLKGTRESNAKRMQEDAAAFARRFYTKRSGEGGVFFERPPGV